MRAPPARGRRRRGGTRRTPRSRSRGPAAPRTRSTTSRRRASGRGARSQSRGRAPAYAARGSGSRTGAARSWSRWTQAHRPRRRWAVAARAGAASRGRSQRRVGSAPQSRSRAYFGGSAAQDVLSREAAAPDRALHRRRPAGVGPRPGADDVGTRGLDSRPLHAGPERDRRVGLAADAGPEQLRVPEPLRELRRDPLDKLASTHLEQLRYSARDDGEVLA